jgi:energy-coupling factor transport system substrate-specific component
MMAGIEGKLHLKNKSSLKSRLFSLAIYFTATISGLLVLLNPFLFPTVSQQGGFGTLRAQQMPMMMILLLGLCLLVLLFEAQGPMVNTKLLALLGILVAINSALRFIETAIPGPGGFTPIFFLIIMVGYVFGGRVGFLMGALTLMVSALITGGVGPWLPAQMFTAGWVGMSTPVLQPLVKAIRQKQTRWSTSTLNPEIILLTGFGLLWGFLYGAIMNLWQWPFIVGPQNQAFIAGSDLLSTLQHYLAFYLVTSVVWDAIAAVGNVLLLLAFGAATLRALRRFQQRFEFSYSTVTGESTQAYKGGAKG